MPNKPIVLIDIHILLDVLQKREPFYEASAHMLASVEAGRTKGYVAAHSITTLFYLIKKDKSAAAEARATITNLLQFIKIAQLTKAPLSKYSISTIAMTKMRSR